MAARLNIAFFGSSLVSAYWNGAATYYRGIIRALYDLILTYGGGLPVVGAYLALGAQGCTPIYNALDPETHHPVVPDERFRCDLAFLGNRLPDREARVDEYFLEVARQLPQREFL